MRHPLDRRWLAVATTLGLIGAGGVLAVGSPATAAAPGCAKLASDFNGDGYGDLAVGEPGTSDPGTENTAGAVRIAYGAAAGIGAGPIPEQTFRRGMPGMPPAGSVSWQLGNSLQAGYLNADCYADLAVSGVYTGEVIVLFGSATGLGTNGAQRIAAPTNVSGDDFGSSLAAGDFDGDGWDELAAGYSDANGVAIYRRAAGGLDTTASSWWSRGTPGVPENVHEFGGFGSQLAAGDFDADGRADLAVGVKRTTATVAQAGGVVVLRGSAAGLTGTGSQWFDQDSPDVPDTNEEGELFGSSLAAGDVNGDRRADLLVGVAAEDVGAVRDAGAVTVLRGSAAGLTGAGSPQITQDSPGVPGSARQGAAFGAALAVGNHNGDGYGDLVVGAPGETIGQAASAGTVTVLYGASTGPVTAGSRHFHQNTRGVADRSEAGDRFGSEVRAVPVGAGRLDTLVVGVPDEVLRGAGEEFSGEGAIVLLRAGSGGLTGPGSRLLTAADFGDKPVRQGWFGTRLG